MTTFSYLSAYYLFMLMIHRTQGAEYHRHVCSRFANIFHNFVAAKELDALVVIYRRKKLALDIISKKFDTTLVSMNCLFRFFLNIVF